MRQAIIVLLTITTSIMFTISACKNPATDATMISPTLDSAAKVERGRYLVNGMGCDDCHSPKRMGVHGPELIADLRFSGFPHDGKLPPLDSTEVTKGWSLFAPDLTAAVGPWGVTFSANITSDETGIGTWTDAQFLKAMREGKSKGMDNGRPILPPMPWNNFKNLSDDDLKSILAFLKTTTPVSNVVPGPKKYSEL